MFLILRGGTLSPFGIDFTISFRDAGSDGAVGVMGGGVGREWVRCCGPPPNFGQLGTNFKITLVNSVLISGPS